MTKMSGGHWTRVHTPWGRDVLGWISDQRLPASKLGVGRTLGFSPQKQKKRKRK